MNPEQVIIERLYREIDTANADLQAQGIKLRISRTLGITDYREPEWTMENITESYPNQSYTGGFCTECGGWMIQTGNCQTCQNCGSTSGGCD